MKLKLKKLRLGAGRPVVVISEKRAAKLNVHINDRVKISHNNKKVVAVVDVIKGFLEKDEISLSEEITAYLKIKPGDIVDVSPIIEARSTRLIAKKLNGQTLKKEEIYCIIKDIVNNTLTEAEVAYFVSGVYKYGMSLQETIYLTEAMFKTGQILTWNSKKIIDKHSIGGIAGNRTTPIIVSICAAAGLIIPKTSSRAITSAAGTADVVESIARVDLSVQELKNIVNKHGACLAWGGSLGLAPADDKLIRVERLLNLDPESQLIASIMSKKLAVGSKYVLIDIPHGPQAKVTLEKAKKLKNKFEAVAKHFKIKLKIVLTDGSQPIGNGIGPWLEIQDILRVLRRDNPPKDLEEKSVMLAGEVLEMSGKAKPNKGKAMALEILNSGKALKKFEEIIKAQEGDINKIRRAKFIHQLNSKKSGKIIHINNKSINLLGKILGCPADKAAGLYLHKHRGDLISQGEALVTFYSESEKKLKEALVFFSKEKPIKIK